MNIRKYLLKFLFYKKTAKLPVSYLNKVKTALYVRDDLLGDFVVSYPFLKGLQRAYPEIKITVLVSEKNQALVALDSSFDKIVVPYRISGLQIFLKLIKFRSQFDLLIDPFDQKISRSAIIYNALKPKMFIGFRRKEKYEMTSSDYKVLDVEYNLNDKNTYFENFRGFLSLLSGRDVSKQEYLNISISHHFDAFYRVEDFVNKQFGRVILFNVDGSKQERRLSESAIRVLSETIVKEKNISVVIIGTPVRIDQLRKQLVFNSPKINFIYSNTSILDLLFLCEKIDGIVSVDTAAIHMASLFNKPIVGIYTVDPNRGQKQRDLMFDPYSDRSQVVFSDKALNLLTHDDSLLIAKEINRSLNKIGF